MCKLCFVGWTHAEVAAVRGFPGAGGFEAAPHGTEPVNEGQQLGEWVGCQTESGSPLELGDRLVRRVLAGLLVASGGSGRRPWGPTGRGSGWGGPGQEGSVPGGGPRLSRSSCSQLVLRRPRGRDELTLEVVVQEESIRNNPAAVEMSEVADMVAQAVEGSGPPVPEAIFGGRNSDNSSALLNHMSSGGECESDGGDSRGAYQSLDTTHSPGRV
eukprot:jgi/Tetstr1/440892/TSEL_029164.t1